MNIKSMTNIEIKEAYRSEAQKRSQLKESYNIARKILGNENEATKAIWNEYLKFDKSMNPLSVRFSQIMMEEQMEVIEQDEWDSITN